MNTHEGQVWAFLAVLGMSEAGLPACLLGWVCRIGQIACCIVIMLTLFPRGYLFDWSLLLCSEKSTELHSMNEPGLN